MNADAQSARDDLAFLRTLVGDDEHAQMRSFGEAYVAAGLIYGGQMLLHAAQALGLLPNGPPLALFIGLGPTILFIPVMAWIIYRNRRRAVRGAVGRAIGSVFSSIGLANLFLIVVIGSVAWREQSIATWLIYPCTVFVLQGTAWLFVYMMRRRLWFLAVALGWFGCAVGMGLTVTALGWFILFAGIGLWFCMALPGWILLRNARNPA
jgi:hypothetical protein